MTNAFKADDRFLIDGTVITAEDLRRCCNETDRINVVSTPGTRRRTSLFNSAFRLRGKNAKEGTNRVEAAEKLVKWLGLTSSRATYGIDPC